MEYSELAFACALNKIFLYSPVKGRSLLEGFTHPSELFALSRHALEGLLGSSSRFIDDILDRQHVEEAQREVEWALTHGVRIYYIGDIDYPKRLKNCMDAPIVLYYKGNADLNSKRVISIVGTRKVTPYGKRVCNEIVELLSCVEHPPTVVSGLAYGVDITAHRKSLECGLETVGVMATGLDAIYPRIHREDAVRMVSQGGIISNFSTHTVPYSINFIQRNRIIAGLSDATILIESGLQGGGMVTSKMAFSYSREVFAVPGRISDELSQGCNSLINADIAHCVSSCEDIIKELGWKLLVNDMCKNVNLLTFESDNRIKKSIVAALLSTEAMDVDTLCSKAECSVREMVVELTEMEVQGRVSSDLLGRFSLVQR